MSKNSLKNKTVSLKFWVLIGIICIITVVWAVDLIRYSVRYTSDNYVGFRDSAIKIYSSTDGQLDIDADTEIELTTTTVDLNGDLDVSGTITSAGVTPGGFWEDVPLNYYFDPSLAVVWQEEFIAVGLDTANGVFTTVSGKVQSATNATLAGWKHVGDAGWTLTQAAGEINGLLTVTHVTGSNNEHYMQVGELGTETFYEYVKSSGKRSWVAFNFASTDITSSAANFFVGLAEEGCAAADFIADAGNDVADKDVIGFVQWEANEDTIEVLYQTAGGAFIDTFKTVITTDLMELGIYFDGDSTVTFYKNGTAIGSILTTATLFPDGEELSPIIATKGGAADRVLNLDYIKSVVER